MSFRGVSLAAGLATRLRPLTSAAPKAKVPVLGIPSLYFSFWQFHRLGIKSWAVNCHHQPEAVKRLIADWPFDASIHVSEEQEIQGSGGCYPLLNDWRRGDHLVVYNPDIMCDFDLDLAIRKFDEKSPAAMIIYTQTPPPGGKLSVHLDQSERVIGIGPQQPEGTAKSAYGAGIFLLHADFLKRIPIGPSSLSTHLSRAIHAGEDIIAMTHPGFWVDMGDSHERYFQAQRQSLAHHIRDSESVFSTAVTNLWRATGFSPKIIPFPNAPRPENMSLITKATDVPTSAKIGPSCFIFGKRQLAADFSGSHCLILGAKDSPLTGSCTHKIINGDQSVDLSIQICE